MDRITLKHLRGACSKQRALFRQTFPEGAPVTLVAARKAVAAGLDVSWLARFLSPEGHAKYQRVTASAWAEYERVTAAARAEYDRVTAPAWAEYKRVKAAALAEYDRVTASALAEYERVKAAAGAEYERVTAAALVRLLKQVTKN